MKRATKEQHDEQATAMRDRGYVTVSEAAELIKVSDATIYSWLKDGTLAHERVGKKSIYIPLDAVRALMGPLGDET